MTWLISFQFNKNIYIKLNSKELIVLLDDPLMKLRPRILLHYLLITVKMLNQGISCLPDYN